MRRVSEGQFYTILMDDNEAFYKMCMALPEMINSAVNGENSAMLLGDIATDELRNAVELC